jgi:ubiquitin-conjugating enzyme E2 O
MLILAKVRYNQIGLDEHLDEISLLVGSTLGLDQYPDAECPIEDVTLYDIRTIGALSRRRGDFVVIGRRTNENDGPMPLEETAYVQNNSDIAWFGEVIDLNLDGTLTIRLSLADKVRDIRLSPEFTTLVHSSDAPSFMGDDDDLDGPYDTGDEDDSEMDYYDLDDSDASVVSDEGIWTMNGEPIAEEDDEEWDTETSESESGDVVMEDAEVEVASDPAEIPAKSSVFTGGQELGPAVKVADGGVSDDLGIQLPESSLRIHGTEDAPAAFDVLEGGPPVSNPYVYYP